MKFWVAQFFFQYLEVSLHYFWIASMTRSLLLFSLFFFSVWCISTFPLPFCYKVFCLFFSNLKIACPSFLFICFTNLYCLVFSECFGCSLVLLINFEEFLDIILFFNSIFFLFWDSNCKYKRLFDIVPQLLGILFCLIHSFSPSLCFSLSDFCWPILKLISFLSCAGSNDEPVGGILHLCYILFISSIPFDSF